MLEQHGGGGQGDQVGSKNLVKIGFSTSKSSLFLGQSADSFCFDSEGFFQHDTTKTKAGQKFLRSDMVAIFLNLENKTVSLFKGGKRLCEPHPIPESLHGKTLYPTVTFKNVTLLVNFGPHLLTS